MTKRFENKELNKDDHAQIDNEARIARSVVKIIGILATAGVVKKIPWKKIGNAVRTTIFRT